MKKVLKAFDEHFEEYLMNFCLWGLVFLMTLQIFCRYVLNSPLSWTDEVSRYLFVWFTFMGVSYCTLTDNHIRIDILETLVPKLKKPFMFIGDAMVLAFALYMYIPSWKQLLDLKARKVTSPALMIPMWIVYLSLFLALTLVTIRLIEKYIRYFTGKQYILTKGPMETDVEEVVE